MLINGRGKKKNPSSAISYSIIGLLSNPCFCEILELFFKTYLSLRQLLTFEKLEGKPKYLKMLRLYRKLCTCQTVS